MQIAGYICELCGHEIFMEVNARSFMPLEKCQSEQCKENQTGGKLSMQIRGSKLLRVQECRIQELVSRRSTSMTHDLTLAYLA